MSVSAFMNKKQRLCVESGSIAGTVNPLNGAVVYDAATVYDVLNSSYMKRANVSHHQISVVDENSVCGSDDNSSEVSAVSSLGSTASKRSVTNSMRKTCCERSQSHHMKGAFFHDPLLMNSATHVALDCEFLGVGPQGKQSALGRCSVVDYEGRIVCDIFTKPEEPITDYRTRWSGLRREQAVHAIPIASAKRIIRDVLKDKIVVGHSLHNDFHVLDIHVSPSQVRDLAKCSLLQKMATNGSGGIVGLKRLSTQLLGRDIQRREHCSIEDARATMDLYKLVDREWEASITARDQQAPSCSPRGAQIRRKAASARTISESYLADEYWPNDLDVDSADGLYTSM